MKGIIWKATGPLLLLLLSVSCSSYPSGQTAMDEYASTAKYRVEEHHGYYAVLPRDYGLSTAILFYPGALVDERSYLPLITPLVEAGYPVYVAAMPMDLAVLNPGIGRRIQTENPHAGWALMGHSLGGAVLSLQWQKGRVEGEKMIFLASYPIDSMADDSLQVLALFAELDGLITPLEREDKIQLFPADSRIELIAGANHAGFADYGPQKKDGTATITKEEQWHISDSYILDFLSSGIVNQ